MPFEVTATRKRPQTFEQLAGQNFVAATLISSLEQGRIAHAYLFSGPRGCGKTSTARILAKALNCEHGPTATPCGTCASCVAISSGTSLDVIEIDGASNTSVDNIRQIKDEVLFAPNSARYKMYIIDEVHMLSLSAFNALLKTIEEPPPYVVFIFATTEPQKVPATIKSRCQQFNFRLVPIETILQLLRQAAEETGIEAEEEALLWIAREAAGSVRDAYTLFDQIASFSGHHITAQNIRETLGLVGIDQLNTLFRAIAQGASKDAFDILDGIFERGVSSEQFLTDAVDYCRSALLMSYGVQKEGLLSSPRNSFEPSVLQSLSSQQLEYAIGVLLDTYRHLKETIDPRYEVELAIAKLSHIGSYISPSELFSVLRALQKEASAALSTSSAPSVSIQSESVSPASTESSSGTPRLSSEEAISLPFRHQVKDNAPQTAPLLRDLSSRLTKNQQNIQESPSPGGFRGRETTAVPKNQASQPEIATSSNPPQVLSSTDLRKKIISKLRSQNLFLASALEKSGEWLPKHNGYIIPVLNRVEMDLIARFSSVIAETGASILGAPCAIEVHPAKNLELVATAHESARQQGTTRQARYEPQFQPRTSAPARAPGAPPLGEAVVPQSAPEAEATASIVPRSSGSATSPMAPSAEQGSSLAPQRELSRTSTSEYRAQELSDPGSTVPKEDKHTIETICKLFKGKVVATTAAATILTTAASGDVESVAGVAEMADVEGVAGLTGLSDTAGSLEASATGAASVESSEVEAQGSPPSFFSSDTIEDIDEYFNTEEEYD